MNNKKFLIISSILFVAVLIFLSACSPTRLPVNKNPDDTSFPLDADGKTNRNVVLINNTEYSITPRKDSSGVDLDYGVTVRDFLEAKIDGETVTVVLPQVSPVMTWRTDTDTNIVKQEEKNAIGDREPAEGESGNIQIFTVKKPDGGKPLCFKFVNINDAEKPFDEVVAAREITINIK